ncbi:MAG: AAA family ATPase [bacterium]|nr:AAA family ATPase [bacterium]
MPKLDKITIENFKSIRSLKDFELKNLNVFIGANGAGKSNFISFFTLLDKIMKEELSLYVSKKIGKSNSFLYGGQKESDYIYAHLDFGLNHYEFRLEPTQEELFIFADETIYFDTDYGHPKHEYLGGGHSETKIKEYAKENRWTIAGWIDMSLASWRVYHFHDTSDTAKVKNGCNINTNRYFHPDASNLAAYLYLLKARSPRTYEKIVDTIKLVAPFFQDFILVPDAQNPEYIRLRWKQKGIDQDFYAHHFSDGTLRFICLATLLIKPQIILFGPVGILEYPQTIVIDEPELGLHPNAITILGSLLKSASTKTQLIVATQSAYLLNSLEPEDIIVVDRKDNQSEFKRLNTEELKSWLEDYSLSELWEKNVFGGGPRE